MCECSGSGPICGTVGRSVGREGAAVVKAAALLPVTPGWSPLTIGVEDEDGLAESTLACEPDLFITKEETPARRAPKPHAS